MIYLVDRRNRADFNQQLEEMYRQRHQVYAEKRGWKSLLRPDKREIDQFDNEDAVYLMKLAEDGATCFPIWSRWVTSPTIRASMK